MISELFSIRKGKGSSTASSAAQLEAEQAQTNELEVLKSKEDSRTAAMGRKRRGRASLISGQESGMTDTLGG